MAAVAEEDNIQEYCPKCDDPSGEWCDDWDANILKNQHCVNCRCRWCVCEHMRFGGTYNAYPDVVCKGRCWHCEWKKDWIFRREDEYVAACLETEKSLSVAAIVVLGVRCGDYLPYVLATLVGEYAFDLNDICDHVCGMVNEKWLVDDCVKPVQQKS